MNVEKEKELESFAERLKIACDTSEPSEIARLLGLPYQTVANYLGGRLPKAEVLIDLSRKTGVSIHWLLTGEGAPYVSESEEASAPRSTFVDALLPVVKMALTEDEQAIFQRTRKRLDSVLLDEIRKARQAPKRK